MTRFTHTTEIVLEVHRCYECRRHFCLEQNERGDCPYCACAQRHERFKKNEAKDRTIAALRGALTKAKRGRR
jgi:hypothetical protein